MPKLLLVEDNEINRDLFHRLEQTGDRAIVASDGAQRVTKTQAASSQIPKSSVERYF
jgi:CheY-like chemotaxis protein